MALKDRSHPGINLSDLETGKAVDLGPILLSHGIETWALIGEADLSAILGSDSGTQTRAAVVVAFPYDPRPASGPEPADQPGGPHPGGPQPCLRVAAFASSHRYTALARLLKATARELAAITGHPYPDFRVAVNSRLPEKHMAARAGLGFRGRSDLLLSHAYGPACILGLLLLPFVPLATPSADSTTQGAWDPDWESPCGSCHACADACPGQAIDGRPGSIVSSSVRKCSRVAMQGGSDLRGTYQREACIQHWMSTMDEPPASLRPAFAGRLYGCDACILACPLSVRAWLSDRADGSSPASRAASLLLPKEQRPGACISASFLMQAGDDELKTFFRKTALGLAWFGPGLLRRNAALGSSRQPRATPAFDDGGAKC